MEQQDFDLYFNITYLLCSFFCFCYILQLTVGKNIPKKIDSILIITFSLLYALLFGFRGEEVGSDTSQYIRIFAFVNSNQFSFDLFTDYFFIFLSLIVGYFTNNPSYMLLIVALLYLALFYKFLINLPIKNKLLIFFVFVSMFFFKSMGINILRQGLAEMLFLVSLTFSMKGERKKYIITTVLTFLSHSTMIIPIIVYLLSKKFYNTKTNALAIVFLMSIILSFLSVDLSLILNNLPFIGDKYLKYLNPTSSISASYDTGFKPQFVFFNTIFFILGYLLIKYFKVYITPFYKRVFFTYTLLSCILFLMFNIPYSDRIGLFSWALIPIIVYPYFSILKSKILFWRWGIYVFCIILFLIFNQTA